VAAGFSIVIAKPLSTTPINYIVGISFYSHPYVLLIYELGYFNISNLVKLQASECKAVKRYAVVILCSSVSQPISLRNATIQFINYKSSLNEDVAHYSACTN